MEYYVINFRILTGLAVLGHMAVPPQRTPFFVVLLVTKVKRAPSSVPVLKAVWILLYYLGTRWLKYSPPDSCVCCRTRYTSSEKDHYINPTSNLYSHLLLPRS